ncbi:hypothetical protein BRSPCE3_52120 [Bradyrhizobium sp. Ce-3]|nr:hypothetical protein BRSPCE3_52120 [Bradyrhizobium sp. Ce-3]
MVWRDFGSSLAITRRRRAVATALMYGLTLTVRFTSAAGEDAETQAQTAHSADAMTSLMISDVTVALSRDWPPRSAQPISLRRGSPLNARGCRTACEAATRMAFVSNCVTRQ